jgi:hypothetical protein
MAAALFTVFKDSIRPAPPALRLLIYTLGPLALALGGRRRLAHYLEGRAPR